MAPELGGLARAAGLGGFVSFVPGAAWFMLLSATVPPRIVPSCERQANTRCRRAAGRDGIGRRVSGGRKGPGAGRSALTGRQRRSCDGKNRRGWSASGPGQDAGEPGLAACHGRSRTAIAQMAPAGRRRWASHIPASRGPGAAGGPAAIGDFAATAPGTAGGTWRCTARRRRAAGRVWYRPPVRPRLRACPGGAGGERQRGRLTGPRGARGQRGACHVDLRARGVC